MDAQQYTGIRNAIPFEKVSLGYRTVLLAEVRQVQFPPELKSEIQTRLDRARESDPSSLSSDRTAICVDGSIGYDCYVSPDGDVFMEKYDLSNNEPPVTDRSRQAQIACLILGSRTLPNLAQLVPVRPADAPTCEKCKGVGWLHEVIWSGGILCQDCSGLGWIEV